MDGEKPHFAPVFPAVATAAVLKSGTKLESFPTHFASTRSAAQTPSSPAAADMARLARANDSPLVVVRACNRRHMTVFLWSNQEERRKQVRRTTGTAEISVAVGLRRSIGVRNGDGRSSWLYCSRIAIGLSTANLRAAAICAVDAALLYGSKVNWQDGLSDWQVPAACLARAVAIVLLSPRFPARRLPLDSNSQSTIL
jgi:hypothetical protein